MDVTPPSALRRLGIALAGLAVAALTGAACALSFDDLRALAVTGEAATDLAYLYPAAFDALLAVALISVLLLRSAKLLVRVQAAFVLVLLIVAAAAVNVATAVRFGFDVRQTAIGVALAPWVMLALALWLWLLLIKHVHARRESVGSADTEPAAEQDIVPFGRPSPDTETAAPAPLTGPAIAPGRPSLPEPAPALQTRAEPAPRTASHDEPAPSPVSAQVSEWPVQEEEERRAPELRPVELDPQPEPQPQRQSEPDGQPEPQPGRQPEPELRQSEPEPTRQSEAELRRSEPRPEPEPQREPEPRREPEPPTRPVRWGDRVKPEDVLVHPRSDDRDADTQPHPVVADDGPDPAHGPEAADRHEAGREDEDTAPHPVVHDETPAPSERLRSTPRPPED
ncbi:DUF2637 domain-containing protein [Nonomuraea sp. B5E05]|uniref:DUF2637 domain-containing protein n=1 Tax=Nonomuraea sp. B5E05 TaxID=3153569 RepID=UPI003260DBAC